MHVDDYTTDMSDEHAEWLLSMADKDSVLGLEVKAYVERLKGRVDQRDSVISGLLGLLGLDLAQSFQLFNELTTATTPEAMQAALAKVREATDA